MPPKRRQPVGKPSVSEDAELVTLPEPAVESAPQPQEPTRPMATLSPPSQAITPATDIDGATVAPVAPVPAPTPPGRRAGWIAWFLGKERLADTTTTDIPPLMPPLTEVKLQEFEPEVTYARIVFDSSTSRHYYQVIEPVLSDPEKKALAFVREVLMRTLDLELEVVSRGASPESMKYLDQKIQKAIREYRLRLGPASVRRLTYYLRRDFSGYGPIDLMMHDPDIEDISCDGINAPIFLYHRKYGSMETDVWFRSTDELDSFVIRMAQRSGKQITIADPLLDSALPDGSRLQATLGREVTDNGSTFTIRRFRENPYTPIDLVRLGTMGTELLAYCWLIVQYGANVILAGGTACGKTTSLNTLGLFIPMQSKIVSIEDTREINLPHPNWVRSVTRGGARATDSKRVDMFDLLTAALRQRPEYILVGEVRGKEASVAFQAMATGHTVLSTIHADSPRSVVYRLEGEPINIPRIVLQSLDVIILQALINVQGRRQRRVLQVAEIVGLDAGSKELLTHNVFYRDPTLDKFHYTGRSYKLERIAQRNNWSAEQLEDEFRRRVEVIETLVDVPDITFAEMAALVSIFDKHPERVDEELRLLRLRAKPEPKQ